MNLRKTLFFLSAAYLAYSLALAIFSPVGFPSDMQDSHAFPYLADKPVGEDGYYMLTVAWNIAAGHGITYNFDSPTTGIQPLATFVYSGLAWIIQQLGGDKWMLIRFIILLGAFNTILFSHLIGRIAQSMSAGPAKHYPLYAYGYILSLCNFTLFRWFNYGLETGMYLTLLAGSLLFSIRFFQQKKVRMPDVIIFGVMAGFTGLMRIDFGIVLLIFLTICLLRKHLSLQHCLIIGILALLIVFPWTLFVKSITGSFIPSSGTAQSSLINAEDAGMRISTMAKIFLGHLTPWAYVRPSGLLIQTLFALGTLLAGLYIFLKDKELPHQLAVFVRRNPFFLTWTLSLGALVIIYALFFWAIHFYQRYTLPLVIPATVILAFVLSSYHKKQPYVLQWAILSFMPAFFMIWAFLSLHTGRIGNPLTVSAGYISDHLGSQKVGVFQSGIIGYFNPNVINLDGKMNYDVLPYIQKDSIEAYIDYENIAYIVDEPPYIFDNLDENWLMKYWQPCKKNTGNRTLCFGRKQE